MMISLIDSKNLGLIDEEVEYNDIEDLAALIANYSWTPGVFGERKRTIKSLSRIDLLVLDIDSGQSLAEAHETFKPYKHIIATSRSHQKEKNGVVCDRFRVVLFLSEPLFRDEDFKATWGRASKLFPFIDPACKDSSRFFFASPGITSVNRDGKLFDISIAQEVVSSPKIEAPPGAPKGELWKSTLEFLLKGAPAGHRHEALITAVGNMREQGYEKPETLEALEKMIEVGGDWTQPFLSQIDLATVDRMYNREKKYGYVPKSNEKNWSSSIVNAAELLDECFLYLADKDKVKGEPTGIAGLDRMLGGGFRTGELSVLMAQAKTGKNTLFHYLIYKHLERGIPFGYASRELNPATEVIPNLLAIALGINTWTADITEAFKTRATQTLSQWPLYFAPGYGHFPFDQIETWFRKCKDIGVNHFLFDHFHYALQGEDYEATASLIKQLKSITKELDIHLSLIVQPRSLREGESLSLATLRGGAAIGQALDNLLILERVRNENNVSKLTLEVARHKLCKLGNIFLQYNPETTDFAEVDKSLISERSATHMHNTYGSKSGRHWPNIT